MKLEKIDHILLLVSDLREARQYFKEILDAHVCYRDKSEKTLIVEIDKVHFFVESHPLAGTIPQHLSFAVNDLSVIQGILTTKEIQTTSGSVDFLQCNNYHWLEWIGPDGIRLECVEYKEQ